MEFYINETKETIRTKHRPIVIITSNAEKELPDAFLRRCIFHYIDFPDEVNTVGLAQRFINAYPHELDGCQGVALLVEMYEGKRFVLAVSVDNEVFYAGIVL